MVPAPTPPSRLAIPSLDDGLRRRLAFSRVLLMRARSDVQRPEPLCGLSLLDLHDAAEVFLRVVADLHHVDIKPKQFFLDYWDPVKEATGVDLGFKTPMSDLNSMRNNLKHAGIAPPRNECVRLVERAQEFVSENSLKLLGIQFESISISDVLRWPRTRTALKEAEGLMTKGDTQRSVDFATIAFWVLMIEYRDARATRFERELDPGSHYFDLGTGGAYGASGDVKGLADSVNSALRELREEIRMLRLGIDPIRHDHFRLLGPYIYSVFDGQGSLILHHADDRARPTESEARFCFEFALESALRLQTLAEDLSFVISPTPSELPPITFDPKPGSRPD